MTELIIPVLLLPGHLTPTIAHLPLLRSVQILLNESYAKAYGAYSKLYSKTFSRITDLDQIAAIVGETGFMVILVALARDSRSCKVVATGSVKSFGEGDIEKYAKWRHSVNGTQSLSQDEDQEPKYEFGAFGVSPGYQSSGLGARVLKEIEWLLLSRTFGLNLQQDLIGSTAFVDGLQIGNETGVLPLDGINIDALKKEYKGSKRSLVVGQGTKLPKLALLCIKNVGSEPYYIRRGFSSVWEGPVPVGMWGNKKECITVYMEKEVQQ